MNDALESVLAQIDAHNETVRSYRDELGRDIERTGRVLVDCLGSAGKVLAFGNGGSAAQADHLVGELVGRFQFTRRPLPAVSLAGSLSTVTCIANDFGYGDLFARQVDALASPGDVAIGLTTSGQSENVLKGLAKARERGAATIALTGGTGLNAVSADYVLRVPSTSTARIQEVHLLIIHIWCHLIDKAQS